VANDFVAALRWPDGPECPICGGRKLGYIKTRRLWECKDKECKKQFSVKVGTTFEDSPIGLDKWIAAVWLIANAKNGISSHEVARSIGVTQKTAWFMMHRIRLAMQTGTFRKFSAEDEADETRIGGKARNMHRSVHARKISGSGTVDKIGVIGFKERESGEVRAFTIAGKRRQDLQPVVRANVEPGAKFYADSNAGHSGL
jgi:transposase-like protein